jgi:hypothetical protein
LRVDASHKTQSCCRVVLLSARCCTIRAEPRVPLGDSGDGTCARPPEACAPVREAAGLSRCSKPLPILPFTATPACVVSLCLLPCGVELSEGTWLGKMFRASVFLAESPETLPSKRSTLSSSAIESGLIAPNSEDVLLAMP